MNRPRAILAAALALILLATVGTPVLAEASFTPTGAVTFTVDHDKKTITAKVRLAFYNRSCSAGASCETPASDIARIVSAIEKMWNTGQKVKCYTFKVEIEARAVGGQSEAGQNEVDVGLDYGPVPVRAFVHGQHAVSSATNPLSNSPDDRVEPVHDPAAPTTWPSRTYDQTYAHEFGHILGLDDNYDTTRTGFPVPGASDDLMFRKQGDVTEEMVKRVVERSGQVDLKDLKCGWTTNADTPLGEIRGTKCDGNGGEWTVTGEEKLGTGSITTLWNITIDETTLAGTFKHEKIQTIGPSVTTSNAQGTARIAENANGSVTMTIDPAEITLKTVNSFGGSGTVKIPGAGRVFLWESDTGGACP